MLVSDGRFRFTTLIFTKVGLSLETKPSERSWAPIPLTQHGHCWVFPTLRWLASDFPAVISPAGWQWAHHGHRPTRNLLPRTDLAVQGFFSRERGYRDSLAKETERDFCWDEKKTFEKAQNGLERWLSH